MDTISILTISDVEEVIERALERHLLQLNSSQNSLIPEMLDKKQVAKILNVSTTTIDNLRRKGLLKATLIGGKVLFKPSDVKDFIDH